MVLPIWSNWWLLVDSSNVHGTCRPVRHRHGSRHGLQDDGETRAAGRDEAVKPLAVSVILCWWYPPADTGMTHSGSNWCFLDFLSYIPNCIGSYTHDLYEAEATQIADKFEEVQNLSTCATPSTPTCRHRRTWLIPAPQTPT